jgi:hypothetical protein
MAQPWMFMVTMMMIMTAGCVRACLQIDPQISTPRCGFMYNCLQNARCMAVSVSVLWNGEQSYSLLCGSHFQI